MGRDAEWDYNWESGSVLRWGLVGPDESQRWRQGDSECEGWAQAVGVRGKGVALRGVLRRASAKELTKELTEELLRS